jgi:hypothetical protein
MNPPAVTNIATNATLVGSTSAPSWIARPTGMAASWSGASDQQ